MLSLRSSYLYSSLRKPRANSGGVCSVGKIPYRWHSASTSSRYVYVGRPADSPANGVLHGILHGVERRVELQDLPPLLERLRERRRDVDGPADHGLDDLRELRRMRGREED